MPYLGIRVQTPFKVMFKVVGEVSKELKRYFTQHSVQSAGLPFLRYHVTDMAGEMDVEYGIPSNGKLGGDERITKSTPHPDATPASCMSVTGWWETKRFWNGP